MKLIAAALLASAAFAQTDDRRVFNFLNLSSPQAMQEFVNTARSIAEIRDITVDPQTHSFKLSATSTQIALTQWLLDALDQPDRPPTFQCRDSGYAAGQHGETIVKVCYPVHLATPQAVQEAVNAVRSIAEIQFVTVVSSAPAVIVRTSAEGAAFAEWILRNFDELSAGAVDRSTRQYRFEETRYPVPVDRRREAVRLYLPASIHTPQQLQESVNVLRSIVEIQRVVAFTAAPAIVIRANDREAEAADWLMRQLEAASSASINFADQVVRTVVFPGNPTPQQIVEKVNHIRSTTGMQRVVAYLAGPTIIVRGTPAQIAAAEELLR